MLDTVINYTMILLPISLVKTTFQRIKTNAFHLSLTKDYIVVSKNREHNIVIQTNKLIFKFVKKY